MYTTEIITITPELAKEMLLSNYEKNRDLKPAVLERYTEDMKNGNWDSDACAPITFSDTGALLDGQHRLMSIVRSDTPIAMEIRRGVPESSYANFDQGVRRTAADALIGMPNRTSITALAACCIILGMYGDTSIVKAFNTRSNNSKYLTKTNILAFTSKFEEMHLGAMSTVVCFSRTNACRFAGWTPAATALPLLALYIEDGDLYEKVKGAISDDANNAVCVRSFKFWRITKGKAEKLTPEEEHYIAWHLIANIAEFVVSGKDSKPYSIRREKKDDGSKKALLPIRSYMPKFSAEDFNILHLEAPTRKEAK